MSSSLASQLQSIASVDASRLTSRYGHPSSKSYLFPAKVAAAHDLDAVHALGQSGFDEIVQLDERMEEFEEDLFSESAKRTDRMMLNQEENNTLDLVLARCLRRLGKWIGIMAGGKCIEWLVRRFRVHEMNAEVLLQVFLPYHDSQNFARILAILTLPVSSPYHAPFSALAKRAQPVPRTYITSAISSARDPSLHLLGDVARSVKLAIDEGVGHRALFAFWTATLVEVLERTGTGKSVPEGVVKLLVEAFVNLLSTPNAGQDVSAAVYPPLVLLTRAVRLADGPFLALVDALLTPNTGANPSQRVLTLLVILDGRKGWTSGLGPDAPAHLAKIPQLGDLLVTAMEKYGFEQALKTVVSTLIDNVAASQKTLSAIVDYPALPASVVQLAATRLLATPLTGADTTSHAVARRLLSTLRQRHPTLIDTAVLDAAADVDPALVQWSSEETAFVDVHSADVASRVSGVREMYAVAQAAGLNTANAAALLGATGADDKLVSAQTAIVARLRDTDDAVIAAVYAEPQLLLALLRGQSYVDAVAPSFTCLRPEQAVIKRHLAFISGTLLTAHPNLERIVFERLLIPNLVSAEERRVFGPDHWALLVKTTPLLERIKADVPAADAGKDDLAKFNQGLIKSLAGSIAAAGDIGARVDTLIAALSASLPGSRLIAALTLAQLVAFPGPYQHVVAARSLNALESLLGGKSLRDVDVVESPLSDALHKAVVSKPTMAKTLHRTYLVLLTASAQVQRSPNVTITWLGDVVSPDAAESQVRTITHALYRWSNSAALSAPVAKYLLHAVLGQLGEDALVFLSSVWTGPADSAVRVAALRHAGAFVQAYSAGANAKATDFQLVIPATLIALQDPAKAVRQAAAELLKGIATSAKSANADIYALETIYSEQSDLVQLLKPSDLQRYLGTITSALDDLVLDAGRLALVHGNALDAQSKNGRKDTSHRRAVVDWLMSHVRAWRADRARRALLSTLTRAVNASRLQGALPLLAPLVSGGASGNDESAWLATLSAISQAEYLDLVFDAFNARHASTIIESDSDGWKLLVSLVETQPSPTGVQLRALALQRFVDGLFAAVRSAQREQCVVALIHSLSALSVDDTLASKTVLSKLALSPAEIVAVIDSLVEPLESPVHRKKAKHDETDEAERIEQAVMDITVLVESRDWKELPGDAPLVAALMGILSSVLTRRQAIKEGVDYLEQEVLGAILALTEKITDAGEILRARVGIEVIVKVIRASTNPRTSQRALLVASELARLIPDAVLHNVMPIFTFMGASDLQRDDAFSFGVVEKTVARIVPVMTRALKDKASSTLELYHESLTFVSIFTDMASRLPKHRTLPFFVHLVKSLGAEDFLPPVSMLLVDRSTAKATRSSAAATGTLDLPLGLAAAFPATVRVETLLEIVREIARLVSDLSSVAENREAFLSHRAATEDDDERTLRRVSALAIFATALAKQLVGKACTQSVVEDTVRDLIALSAATATDVFAESDIPAHIQSTLSGAIQLLSVDGFLAITVKVLESGKDQDVRRALDVFTQRLPLVKPDLRIKATQVVASIIRLTAAQLQTPANAAATLAALHAVVASAQSVEHSALASIVPAVVAAAKSTDAATAASSLSLLEALVRHLASRAIPFIQSVVETSLEIVRGGVKAATSQSLLVKQSFATVSAIVETVPTFVSGKQLVAILRAATEHRARDESVSNGVISTVAKKIPTKTLVPVIMDLWKAVQSDEQASIEAFFHLVRLALRHADRKVLPTLTKPVFAFFLDVFDLRHRLQPRGLDLDAINAIETSAIGSFLELVTKLSESTFKPLFVRLYDWAVIDLAEGKPIDDPRLVERQVVLLHVMSGLLEKFRHLLTPYIGILLPRIEELLDAYADGTITDVPLWTLVLDVLAKSLDVDEGAYWTDAAITKIMPELVDQLGVLPDISSTADSPVARVLGALAVSTTSEIALKKLNTSVCLATRADVPRARIAALRALDTMWERHADEMIQFAPETVSEFLAELLEDENAEVEGMARKVLARIETLTGSLKEYLE